MQSIDENIDKVDGIRTRVKAMEELQCRDIICPPPKSLKIELSSKCNLQCDFCYNKNSARKSFLDFSDYEKIIKEAAELGIEQVGLLFLGESTLYPQLVQAIKLAKEKYKIPYVFLTTNGVLMSGPLMRDICETGLDSLKWSINHPTAISFYEHTKVNAFDTVVKNIRDTYNYVKQNNLPIKLYASSAVYDVNNVEDRMKWFVEVYVKPYVDEHYFFEINNQGGLIKDSHFQCDSCNRLPIVPCPRLFNNSYITSDFKVAYCCAAFNDKFIVGDLHENSFMEIWNSEKMRKLRKAHLDNNLAGTICYEKKD